MVTQENIVLFDGVCNLCSGFVQFVIKREKDSLITFASLQSSEGQKLLNDYGVDSSATDSIVFIANKKAFIKSRAFFEIIKHLKNPWPFIGVFSILPVKVTDVAYDIIARNRYRLLGKKESCWLPSKSISGRFLDSVK
ncbi:thiol-disulfide oxidoreductase DCC family protein [Flagellimonas sp. GZD32]|uniref:thiol-disulfide oxidoreductase DCC family protein n=1 Tax=Flagellimonas cixiensis TaxID=3228750 RepID=UPI0035C93183